MTPRPATPRPFQVYADVRRSTLSLWQVREMKARLRYLPRQARGAPNAARSRVIASLAKEYGVCTRTIQRYAARKITIVRCAGWEAAFSRVNGAAPRQLTNWTPADTRKAGEEDVA